MTDAALVADADLPRQGGADRPITHVAVGVLIHQDGSFLLTSRPLGKAYAGYWEFPGGKLEAGETVHDALARELHEELGICVSATEPWKVATVDYPHALVCLNFRKVSAWSGQLEMREGQEFSWQRLPVQVSPVLPGAVPVLEWLALEAKMPDATN
jgi:8-oxo-dGTP diphosphatase